MANREPTRNTVNMGHNHGPVSVVGPAIQNNYQRISGWSIAALCLGLGGFTIVSIPLAIIFASLAIAQLRKMPSGDTQYAQPMGGMQPDGPPPAQPVDQPAGPAPEPAPATPAGNAGPAPEAPADTTASVSPDPTTTTGPVTDPVTSAAYAPPPPPPTPGTPPAPDPGLIVPPDFVTGAVVTGYPAAKAVSVVFVVIAFFSSTIWAGVWTVTAVEAFQYAEDDIALSCEPTPGYANACTLATGDCFDYPAGAESGIVEVDEVELIDCGSPHNAQAVGSFTASGTDWPGWDQFYADAEAQCWPIAEQNVDSTLISSDTYVGFIAPDEASWEYGVRNVTCMVFLESGTFTGSVLN